MLMNIDRAVGKIISINGPVIKASGIVKSRMNEQVEVGPEKLIGEIIELDNKIATIQVYELTTGLTPGMDVYCLQHPLSVELGPGLMSNIYDGIQRPLKVIAEKTGAFIDKGVSVEPLDRNKKWHFIPKNKNGDKVNPLHIFGTVKETKVIEHRLMIPDGIYGQIIEIADQGEYNVDEVVCKIDTGDSIKELTMVQRWPIRQPRPIKSRIKANVPLITGQRIIDFFFPIPKGGASAIPGGFGTGKTITQHQLAKWSDADIIVYIGCGERGNEMTQVLEEFPKLKDPRNNLPLMERTILIANTSNMPVTAREASIYTGITLAEYYRDMGYNIALMADSTSRWAEALREIAGRLEEMPAEEGFPAYLASRLAEFYERAGKAEIIIGRQGSITVIGAVSPPGGDFSEPVTQHTKRFTRAFWALDKELASRRHFPAINWNDSYSEYINDLKEQLDKKSGNWYELRKNTMNILKEEEQLQRIVKLVGPDALPDNQRLILEIADLIKKAFLQQNAFHNIDSFCPMKKQVKMMELIMDFYYQAKDVIQTGIPVMSVMEMDIVDEIVRMKTQIPNDKLEQIDELRERIKESLKSVQYRYR